MFTMRKRPDGRPVFPEPGQLRRRLREVKLCEQSDEEEDAFDANQTDVAEDESEAWSEEAWRQYQLRVNADLQKQRLAYREPTGGARPLAPSSVCGSSLSALERDTLLGSTAGEQNLAFRRGPQAPPLDLSAVRDSRLAIVAHRDTILQSISLKQITIITGATGCGKTTQVPRFILLDRLAKGEDVNIVVTQPRRLAAQSVARRVSQELNVQLGTLVGYKVGLDKSNFSDQTKLLYCTTGVLKKMIVGSKSLSKFTHVVLDEVHEREEDMDFLLLLCKKLLFTNSQKVSLVLMSATIQVDQFMNYFKILLPTSSTPIYPSLVNLTTTTGFHVDVFHRDTLPADLIDFPLSHDKEDPDDEDDPLLLDENIKICTRIIERLDDKEATPKNSNWRDEVSAKGAVLVFLPGEYEILRVQRALQELEKSKNIVLRIFILHSRVPLEDSMRIFQSVGNHERKVVLATNMAESSITIPDISYVIDFGLTKLLYADPNTNYVSLKLNWADRNSMEQRKGRAGRVKNGCVYRLITEAMYATLPQSYPPEILRAPLNKVILDTKLLDSGPPKQLLALAMDPPNLSNINKTVADLKLIGALLPTVNDVPSPDDGDLTTLGEIVASLPVDVMLGKLVLLGYLMGVGDECIIMAAGLSNKSVFVMPFQDKLRGYANKLVWSDRSFSDCLAMLHAVMTWRRRRREGYFERSRAALGTDQEHRWCRSRFLQLKVLKDVEETMKELKVALKRLGLEEQAMPNIQEIAWESKLKLIYTCIFGAFYPNYFRQPHGLRSKHDVDRALYSKDPTNTVYLVGFPESQVPFAPIYYEDIRKLLHEVCGNDRQVDVEVRGRYIYIQFAHQQSKRLLDVKSFGEADHSDLDKTNLTGKILHQVYLALRLRRQLCLRCYTDEAAEQRFQEWKIEQQLSIDNMRKNNFDVIGRVPSPFVEENSCKLIVTHVDSPSSFWVNIIRADYVLLIEPLTEAIHYCIAKHSRNVRGLEDLMKNHVYLAPYQIGTEDVEYYRARLDRVVEDKRAGLQVEIFYIDFGNRAVIQARSLKVIDDETMLMYPALVSTPALALECRLANVKPNPARNTRGEWDTSVLELLSEAGLAEGCEIEADIYSVLPQFDSPQVNCIVNCTCNGCQSINQLLTLPPGNNTLAYGVECQESSSSREQHEARANWNFCQDFSVKKALEKEQNGKFKQRITFKNDDREGKVVNCSLKGPSHPLEYAVDSIQRTLTQRKCNIEPDSVNSVLLDDDPMEKHDMWLVAAHVGHTSGNDGNLILRSTTLMPNKPGIGSLLVMAFAPNVELRRDANKENYAGVLAGMGHRLKDWGAQDRMGTSDTASQLSSVKKSQRKVAAHPNSDMEVTFDTVVDTEDLANVHKIRSVISNALVKIPTSRPRASKSPNSPIGRGEGVLRIANASELLRTRQNLIRAVNSLWTKKRESRRLIPGEKMYKWGCVHAEEQLAAFRWGYDEKSAFLKHLVVPRLSKSGEKGKQ